MDSSVYPKPCAQDSSLLKSTGTEIYKLLESHPDDTWIHLVGEDSAARYFAGNAPDIWFSKPNRQTWVADRPSEKAEYHVNPSYASRVKTFNPQGSGPQTSEEHRASSIVRKN